MYFTTIIISHNRYRVNKHIFFFFKLFSTIYLYFLKLFCVKKMHSKITKMEFTTQGLVL